MFLIVFSYYSRYKRMALAVVDVAEVSKPGVSIVTEIGQMPHAC